MTAAALPELPERLDVVVVGGGIAGASTVFHLAQCGVEVGLLERDRVGQGTTATAVGVLFPPVRQPFHALVRHRGLEVATAIWRFAERSVAGLGTLLEGAGRADAAELDLRGGCVPADRGSEAHVRGSFEALSGAGLPVTWLDAAEVEERCGGRGFVGGYLYRGVGALAPEPTTRVVAELAAERGARIFEGTPVIRIRRDARGLLVETDRGEIRTEMVIYANHLGARRFSALVHDELVPIRGQGLTARVEGLQPQPGGFATHWKMNLWRQGPDGRVHLGGWRHDAWDRSYWKTRPEVDDALQSDLVAWFAATFPGARLEVERQWGGVFAWTSDFLPLIGPLPGTPDELVIAGFSGGGLPFAFEGGRLLAHAVAGRDPVEGGEYFHPRRFL